MKLSLFTPTNNPSFLRQVYDSLRLQDHEDWEWTIVLNGAARDDDDAIRSWFVSDRRVRVHRSLCQSANVGALKLEACNLSTGDAFVEMDHDDMLVPGALTTINRAFEGGAGFVYSDAAVFEEDLSTWGYHASYGWEHYPVTVYNKRFIVTKTFPISPRSLCEVYYAPDHVRAWSRDAYRKVGGHDPELSVGDDHDLTCRTYIGGHDFAYTGNCCYLYRVHSTNTVKLRFKLIQEQQARNRQKYLHALVNEWCRRNGHETFDLLSDEGEKRWKAGRLRMTGNDRYGRIVASDSLQFLDPPDVIQFFNDAYRLLVPGGYLHVTVPSPMGRYADQNPFHRTRFNENTFLHFSRAEFAQNVPGVNCRFDLIQTRTFYPDDDFKRWDMKVLGADMCALKGQRHPGPKLI